ncbi:unnamed protein product [Auanema sp. JU1783]|nr:unnamed protein product [Auanema sp. JU1783]
MSAMFANTRANQSSLNTASPNLIEFKAGRSNLQAGTENKKKVVADKCKGTIIIKQSSDQLMHFCWKNRETGAIVDDLIIFPGDTEFREVKGCPDGQVFMLKFKTSNESRFFWVQEPDIEKDIVQKVNDTLNKPPSQRMAARGGSSERHVAPSVTGFPGTEEFSTLGGIDHQQLVQLLQFMNPGNNSESGLTQLNNASNESELQQLVNQLQQPEGSQPYVHLDEVLSGERVAGTVQNNQDRLLPHIPESDNAAEELASTIHSPQFKQATNAFGQALQTGQMGPVLERFGVSSEATKAAANGNLVEFAKKLTEVEQGTASTEAGASASDDNIKEPVPKKGKPDDDTMDLD